MFWYRVDKPFWWKLLCETYQFVRIFSIQGFRLFNRYSIDFWIWPRYYDINMTIFNKVDYIEIEPALFPNDLVLLHRNVYCICDMEIYTFWVSLLLFGRMYLGCHGRFWLIREFMSVYKHCSYWLVFNNYQLSEARRLSYGYSSIKYNVIVCGPCLH